MSPSPPKNPRAAAPAPTAGDVAALCGHRVFRRLIGEVLSHERDRWRDAIAEAEQRHTAEIRRINAELDGLRRELLGLRALIMLADDKAGEKIIDLPFKEESKGRHKKAIKKLKRELLAAADDVDAGVLVLTAAEREMKSEILHRARWGDRPPLKLLQGGKR